MTLAVVTLQTFYLGGLYLLTVYQRKLDVLSVTDFSILHSSLQFQRSSLFGGLIGRPQREVCTGGSEFSFVDSEVGLGTMVSAEFPTSTPLSITGCSGKGCGSHGT